MKIVIINGTGGSGKNTFTSYCGKYAKVYNYSSVFKVKEAAKILGWTGEKEEYDRKFLSDLKLLSSSYNDFPFRDIESKVAELRGSDIDILFIHIREPKDIKRAKDEFGATTVLIRMKNLLPITSNMADRDVENYSYDYIVENNNLDDLDKKAMEFVNKIL